MGRLIGWLLGFPLAVAAISFAVSNRAPVAVDLWPLPWAIEAPLYLFVLLALAVGFLAGGTVAWAGSIAARRRIRAEIHAEGARHGNPGAAPPTAVPLSAPPAP